VTADPDPRDEARLQRLFDASAAELSGPMLTKLRARAREVPERTPRAPRWLPRWMWSPLLAGFAVGAGALAVAIGVWVRSPDTTAPAQSADPVDFASQHGKTATAPASVASTNRPAPSADDALDALFLDDSIELAADFDLDVDEPYLDFDPLDEPAADDLDAWWLATEDLVEGGG
jgi:hypothetical protein